MSDFSSPNLSSPDRSWDRPPVGSPATAAPTEPSPSTAQFETVLAEFPAIAAYFDTLNASDFDATARLFAENGVLVPPFEAQIVGPEAIAAYLKTEARQMELTPQDASPVESLDEGYRQTTVTGRVQTPWFGVRVGWRFVLDPRGAIAGVRVDLLATMRELFELSPFSKASHQFASRF